VGLAFAAELFAASTGGEGSRREYRGVMRSLSRHLESEGPVLCSELSWPALLSYQVALSPLAASTRHHRLLLVRQFLRFLEESGWAAPGISRSLRVPPLPRHHPLAALSVADSQRLLLRAPNRRSRLLIWLLLGTGARLHELLCCDLSSLQEGLILLAGKTGSRSVPLPVGLSTELASELEGRRGEGLSSPLFRSRQGRLSDRRARELLLESCLLAELPPMSPHALRHAACARWLRAGVPLLLVSQALGHARPSTTLDHYASVTAFDLERGFAQDPLEQGLAGPQPEPPLGAG
jgi:site-specific recombinase XerD